MVKWIDELFSVNKTAEQTDSKQEFQKKVKASGWLENTMNISEDGLKKEENSKIEAELAVRDELVKEAAYEPFQTTEETLKHDYKRDVEILSDFTLASMIAEMRGHKKQDFPENATKYFEEAKADVKKDRKAVEKELLEGTGMSAQLDTFKAFADYKKDETPKQATEKELYQPQLKDVNDDLSKGGKVDAYAETDEQHAKTMLGIGREEKERTDVTAQPGEIHKDASLNKEASLDEIVKAIMNGKERIDTAWGTKTAMGIRAMIERGIQEDAGNPRYAPDYTASKKEAALVRDPDVELKVGSIIRLARSIMSHEGQILNEGTSWEISAIDGFHYRLSANGQTHVISSHDTPKFNKIASQSKLAKSQAWDVFLDGKHIDTVFYNEDAKMDADEVKQSLINHDGYEPNIVVKKGSQEITNHATKEQVIAKIAEIKSPWCVVEKDGQEVIARISDEQVVKQSEEDKKDLNK